MFFRFPEDARWNANMQAVEFGVGIGEYDGRRSRAPPGLPAFCRWSCNAGTLP
jgi:hypothetical protein